MSDDTVTRKCKRCGIYRPLKDFYTQGDRRSRNRPCRYCCRDEMNARVAKQTAYIQRIKLERGCADCGLKTPHPEVYDFDHRPDVKKVADIAKMRLGAMAALVAEIAKCDVVCANCHRIRTAARRDPQKAFGIDKGPRDNRRNKRNGYAIDLVPVDDTPTLGFDLPA